MIDAQAVALVKAAEAKLSKMKDARPSELMAVKEALAEALLALLTKAAEGITDAQKIKLFDSLLASEVEHLTDEVKSRIAGTYCDDDDHKHYVSEEVRTGTLGPKIYDATNPLEKLFSSRRR